MTDVHVIWHAGCPDGFASYWAVTQRYGRENVISHEGRYGHPPPDLPPGCDLIIADFSYPRAAILDLADHVGRLRVFDHHQTAEADLTDTGLDEPDRVVFDMARSGAGITWDELFGHDDLAGVRAVAAGHDFLDDHAGATQRLLHTKVVIDGQAARLPQSGRPVLLNFVEARDLWRMQDPQVPEIGAFVMTLEHDLDVWDAAMAMPRHELISAGRGALAQRQQMCRALLEHSYMAMFQTDDDLEWRMPVVNAQYSIGSEAAQAIMEHHNSAVAAYYFQRGDLTWQYGFRSRGNVDCTVLAQAFGGGGHKHAAGCQGFATPIHEPWS